MIDLLEEMNIKDFGKFIKRERIERGYTVQSLSEKLDIKPNTISIWERGIKTPSGKNMNKLLKFFVETPPLKEIELEYELIKRHWWPKRLARLMEVETTTVLRWIHNGKIPFRCKQKVAQILEDEPREKYDFKAIRERCNIDRQTVADFMGVAKITMRHWENGYCRPRDGDLDKLIAFYESQKNK